MILLKSYPKSGNTWIRFILCNLLYPDVEHDFSTIKKYCPTFEDEEEKKDRELPAKLVKTHDIDYSLPSCVGTTIYIHRHVGDVLVSFWWHCKKFFNEKRALEKFCEDLNYGEGWREFVNASSLNYIKYEYIDDIDRLILVTGLEYSYEEWEVAIMKSSFNRISRIEKNKGIGCKSDSSIDFCRSGNSLQYYSFNYQTFEKIFEKNKKELNLLGYETFC